MSAAPEAETPHQALTEANDAPTFTIYPWLGILLVLLAAAVVYGGLLLFLLEELVMVPPAAQAAR